MKSIKNSRGICFLTLYSYERYEVKCKYFSSDMVGNKLIFITILDKSLDVINGLYLLKVF